MDSEDYNQILNTLLVGTDMDDAGIHYFTYGDLEQVWGAAAP